MTPEELQTKVTNLEELLGDLLLTIESASSFEHFKANAIPILEEYRSLRGPKGK